MTNKEALVAILQVSVDDNVLEKALLDQNVRSDRDYKSAYSASIDVAAISVLEGLLSTPDIAEGGYSVTYDRASIQDRLSYLRLKNGVPNLSRQVKGASPW